MLSLGWFSGREVQSGRAEGRGRDSSLESGQSWQAASVYSTASAQYTERAASCCSYFALQ